MAVKNEQLIETYTEMHVLYMILHVNHTNIKFALAIILKIITRDTHTTRTSYTCTCMYMYIHRAYTNNHTCRYK